MSDDESLEFLADEKSLTDVAKTALAGGASLGAGIEYNESAAIHGGASASGTTRRKG